MAKQILVRPFVTEKATALSEDSNLNQYTFIVNKDANKLEVKQAVEARYGVTVTNVRTLIVASKKKSRYANGKMAVGYTNSYKKAIVTLPEGEIIDFYEGM